MVHGAWQRHVLGRRRAHTTYTALFLTAPPAYCRGLSVRASRSLLPFSSSSALDLSSRRGPTSKDAIVFLFRHCV